jgi:uncharacterized membrane protein
MRSRGSAFRPTLPTRFRQRGASAVFVGISMVASIAALGMALDLGRLYYTHRDLQLMADMAALDAARAAGGCMGKVDDRQGAAAGEAASSLQRNGGSLAYLSGGAVELGREGRLSGVRTFIPDTSTRADSVRVTLRRPLPAKLVPIFSSGPGGTMTVTAAATMRPIVSFDVGSGLANVNSPVVNDILGRLLGVNASVGVLDLGGLANVNVSLGDLAAATNAGSVQNFLDTQTTAPALLSAIADALSGTTDAAVRTTLSALATGGDAASSVVPSEILGVRAGGAADDALVNVGTLVTELSDSTDGTSLLDATLPVNLPLLGPGNVAIHLVELPRPAIGPPLTDASGAPQTVANTAQGTIIAGFSPRLTSGVQANLKMYAQVAAASGGVADLECSQRGRPDAIVAIDTQLSAARFGIGDLVDLRSPDPGPVTIIELDPVTHFGITARINFDFRADRSERLTFEGPFPAPPQVVGTDVGAALEGAIDNLELGLTGPAPTPRLQALAATALTTVEPEVKMLFKQLARNALTPAADVLGASLGTAQVTVRSVTVDPPAIYAR